ncbi:D-amino acid dehydrogenase [soil metagenome]
MGAGIIGVSTAWYLLDEGHTVTIVDRQPDAALETSFANGAQISVSFCEPWANPRAPAKVLKWLTHDDAPLLFRPRLDPYQWRWAANFMGQCTDAAFMRNVRQLVALGRYSHASLKALVAQTNIEYNRLERGILHFFTDPADLLAGAKSAALMMDLGVERHVLTRERVIETEPALERFSSQIYGGVYTPTDESGDAHIFTQALQKRCVERGATFLFGHEIEGFDEYANDLRGVKVRDAASGARSVERGDAYVAAMGSFTAPLLRQLGVDFDIYPTKGYSATLRLLQPERANFVSLIDDERKIAISRLGDYVRIAGTAEMAGYDMGISSAQSRLRCNALVTRFQQLFPGVADIGAPVFWAGLRPSTPSNVPLIGRTKVSRLWVNSGHGTLGWTLGAGSGRALALLISGKRPDLDFAFHGDEPSSPRARAA